MATKKSELVLTCNAAAMKDVIEFLDKKLDELIKKRDKLNAKGVQNWTAQDKKNFKQWGDDIAALTSKQQKNREEMVRYGQVMKDLAGAKTKDLKRALGEVKRALDNMSARDPKRKQLEADLKKIQRQIDANTVSVKKNQSAWGSLGTTLKNLVAYAGVFAMFNRLKSLFGDFVTLNRELSDQLANIRKVSGLAMQDIYKLEVNLAKIDTRSSIQQLNELAYAGAKLGFGNLGVDALEGFVKSAVKVQNALSEDMGSEAMTSLSKMVEVMGLIPKMGVEKAMDATGSAIFKLASTSTATGTNIVEFSKRLMGLANIAHITTPELLAIGSAADSMALMPEVAATAFNKLITAMQKQPNLIENALKIDKGTISNLYQAGKMTDAMVLVFEKMREKGGMNALMQSGVFKDLGSDGARLVAVMATMANRVDMLKSHISVANEAFEDATAVAKEYEIQMDTAQAYAERASNVFAKAFVNPEGVDVVKDFSKAWYEVAKSLTANETFMFSIQISLKGILLLLKGIMTILPELLAMVLSGAAWAWITRLREGEGLLTSLTAWFGKLTAAQKAFFKAAGWVGLALTVYEVGKAFYNMANNVKKANEYMKGFNATLSDVNKEQYTAVRRLDGYVKAINEATVGTNQRKAAINNFNKVFKPYLSAMLTEKSTALDVAKAYQEVVKQMKAKIALQAKEKDIEKFVNPRLQWEADKLEAYDESIGGTGNEQYNGAWLKGFVDDARAAGKSISDVAKELNDKIFHLDSDAYANVYRQRDKANVRRYAGSTTMNTSAGAYTVDNYETLGAQTAESQLQKAIQYAMQSYSTSNAISRINKKYKPWEEDIDNMVATEEEPTYDPLKDARDKDAEREAQKALREAKQAMRKEMEDAQKESTGVLSKLEEWYRLQEAAITEARADGKMTEEQATQMVRTLGIIKNESLATARRAITTGDTEAWDELKNNVMPKAMADASDLSQNLLETIQNVPVKVLHDNLAKFNGDAEKVFGLDSRAFFDQINAKAAGNTREAARLRAKMFQQAEKLLEQYEMVRVAQKKMQTDLEGIGLYTETYEEFAQRMQQGITEKQPKQLKNGKTITDEEAYGQMGAKFIGQGTIPYRINIENADEALQWLHDFATNAKGELEDWAQAFPDIEKWATLLQRKNELQQQGKKLTAEELAEMSQIPEKLAEAIPIIRAMFYQLETSANNVAETIKKQVEAMTDRKPIGIDERGEQHAAQINLTSQLYDNKISEARSGGNEDAALQLEEQKKQALIDLEYQYQQELWQIREQMGATVFEQYENEVAMYKNMLDKKLITEKQFQQKKGQLQMKLGLNVAQQYNGMMSDMINALQEAEIASVEAKYDAEIQAAQANGQDTTALEEQKEAEIMEIRKKYAGMQFAVKISEIIANTAVAIMQAYAQLGPIGGSIAAAMLTVTGAAQLALAKAEYDKVMGMQAGGSKKSASSANTKTKLVSGMLTYDKGNVDKFAGRRKLYDDGETQVYGRRRYLGEDGKVYTATEEAAPKDGLVTHPIATTVQGQPALVAENGPEIVIGRETTKAIMMNEPELIRYLANYQKNGGGYRPYDSGNLGSEELGMKSEEFATADNGQSLMLNGQLLEVMQGVLYYLQHPVRPKIDMYSHGGEDGLYDSMKKATAFMGRYGG